MIAISVNPIRTNDDGSRVVDTLIVANETPESLPTSGAGVHGLMTDDTFAPMSVLYVIGDADSKVYLANESGEFVAQ